MEKQLKEFVQKIKTEKKGSFLLFVPEKEMESCSQFLKKELFNSKRLQVLDWLEPGEEKVDSVRFLLSKMEKKPISDFKVLALKHFNLANKSVQNALLKALEETRIGQVYILFASSEEGVLETVLSRCQKYYFYFTQDEKDNHLELTNLDSWMQDKPKNREELKKLLFSWLLALRKEKNKIFLPIILSAYLQAKKININLDLFWLNLYILLRKRKLNKV